MTTTCNATIESYLNAVSDASGSCKINDPKTFCSTTSCSTITAAGKLVAAQGCGKDNATAASIKYSFPNMCDSSDCQALVSKFTKALTDCTYNPQANPDAMPTYAVCAPCRTLTDASFQSSLGSTCGYAVNAFPAVLSDTNVSVSITICSRVSPTETSSTSSSTSTIVFVLVGLLAAVLFILGARFLKRMGERAKMTSKFEEGLEATQHTGSIYVGVHSRLAMDSALFMDDALMPFRIPQSDIHNISFLDKGERSAIFRATFGQDMDVAMKQLLPSKAKDAKAVQAFVQEIRFAIQLDHPKIVKLIGVTWSTTADVAVLSEFMPRGDLTSCLKKDLKKSHRQLDWDAAFSKSGCSKTRIAVDIVDALVYLHSFQPTTLHRNVSSRCILLNDAWDAKLHNFGIGRVSKLETMPTSGMVPWIAPEVLTGGQYTEKADIYALGVLLAELDTHQDPYFKLLSDKSKDISMAHVALQVAQGTLQPEFTNDIPIDILELAMECLAFDPKDRPAAMALSYKLHTILKNQD
ncbi:hypothetical protein AC1031_016663 [Aphanomyces cochlioides]|nr:hypothetical protein AC1031_016663 [Aphanomyces cochlioides]